MSKWTREGIIRDILRREAQGLSLTLSVSEGGIDPAMYQAASRIFGSWRNAVMAAGLPGSRSKTTGEWTPARIRKLIRSLAQRQRPLSKKELLERYGYFVHAARRHFGSWSKAVASAGVDPQKMKRHPSWSKDRVIEQILLLSLRNESNDFSQNAPRMLRDTAVQLFGSWQAAIDAAAYGATAPKNAPENMCPQVAHDNKLPGETIEHHRPGTKWSIQQIFSYIHRRAQSGKSLRATEVCNDDCGLYVAGTRRFGNWRNTLVAAGIDPVSTARSGINNTASDPPAIRIVTHSSPLARK